MLKANSLLYAVYVCLIVSLLCAGLLYLSTLYIRLNDFYNTQEELLVQNESYLNFALANLSNENQGENNEQGFGNSFSIKQHGLLKYTTITSNFNKDTLQTIHFIGKQNNDDMALYVPKSSLPINYSGNVIIDGDFCLPSQQINLNYLTSGLNSLKVNGKFKQSEDLIPKLNEEFLNQCRLLKSSISNKNNYKVKTDTINSNSFANSQIHLLVSSQLNQLKIEGNFIINNNNFIEIGPETKLNDVVVFAPKIKIKKDFKGTAQFLATEEIIIEDNVELYYPSAVCIYNSSEKKSLLSIGENVTIQGLIASFGYTPKNVADNEIYIGIKSTIIGTIYCFGNLTLQANVIGSIYTNKISGKTSSGQYENNIINVSISKKKLPKYYVPFDLFQNDLNKPYAVIKKTY
jgi:hypothetical protein